MATLLMRSLRRYRYTSKDVRIFAMVGSADGTKYSMQPAIRSLRNRYPRLMMKTSLRYWENANGGHSQESLEAEVRHVMPSLFQ